MSDEALRAAERRAVATLSFEDIGALQREGDRAGRNFALVRQARRVLLSNFAALIKKRMIDALDDNLIFAIRVPDEMPGGREAEYGPGVIDSAIKRIRERMERNMMLGMVEPQPEHVRNDRIELRRVSHLITSMSISGNMLSVAVKLLRTPEGMRLRDLLIRGVPVRPNLIAIGNSRIEHRKGANAYPGAHAGSHRRVRILEHIDIHGVNLVAWPGAQGFGISGRGRRNVEGFSPLADAAENVLAEHLEHILPTPPLPPTREGTAIIEGAVFSVVGDDGAPYIDVQVPVEFIGRVNNEETRNALREWFRQVYGA